MKIGRTVSWGFGLLVLALASVVTPVQAQTEGEGLDLDRESLTQYAIAHGAINDARDEFHGKVARVHDAEGRLRAREEVEAAIVTILEGQEMTREEYDEVTLLISLDGDFRVMFDEIMLELEELGTT
jgi:predicted transcriptional regulator